MKPLMVETDRIESIDIDEKQDYDLACCVEKFLNTLNNKDCVVNNLPMT